MYSLHAILLHESIEGVIQNLSSRRVCIVDINARFQGCLDDFPYGTGHQVVTFCTMVPMKMAFLVKFVKCVFISSFESPSEERSADRHSVCRQSQNSVRYVCSDLVAERNTPGLMVGHS